MSNKLRCKSTISFLKSWVCSCVLVAITLVKAYGQSNPSSFEKAVDFLPPPPNAAAMIQYGNASVNKNTGTPNINIPLFTLKGYKLSTTVSLGYSSSGIKVDEVASRVGMGWSINAGGVITRTVRGKPDELNQREYPNADIEFNWPTYSYMRRIVVSGETNGRDAEPDIYNFSFDGYSGSFVTDGLGHPFLINKNGLKIKYPQSGDTWDFKIITPEGVSYLFGGTGKVEKTKRTQSCGKSRDSYIPTAYYLSKIIHLNGETITFNYTTIEYTYPTNVSQTLIEQWGGANPGSCPIMNSTCSNITNIQGVLLNQILTNHDVLTFNYIDRQDCPGDKLVSKIIYSTFINSNSTNIAIGSFDFTYTTINSDESYNSSQFYTGVNKTPYLVSLIENSADNNLHKTHYFSYDHPENRPSRLSFSQDHWGYFNGKRNLTFIPKLGDVRAAAFQYNFPTATADREPDFAFSRKGLLQKIVYPTGGVNMLFYEPNIYHEPYEIDYSNTHSLSCSVTGTGTGAPWTEATKTVSFHVGYEQLAILIINCTANAPYETIHNVGSVRIPNLIINGSALGGTDNFICSPSDPPSLAHKIVLEPGDYTIELKAAGSEITTSATLQFAPVAIPISHPDQIVGGVRIGRIITTNPNETPMVKRYFYGTYDDLTTSSLSKICGHPLYSATEWCNDGTSHTMIELLYSSSLLNLGFFNNGYVSYNSVVESNGENFEGGGTETKFYTGSDNLGVRVWPKALANGSFALFEWQKDIPNSPFSNFSSYVNGKPYSETILKKMPNASLKPVKKTEYFYTNETSSENTIFGYSVVENTPEYMGQYDTLCDLSVNPNDNLSCANSLARGLGNHQMVRYSVFSSWVVPEYTTETIYDENGENSVDNTTNYFYDNADNFQLTKTESYTSEGKLIRTTNKYPHDFGTNPVYQEMVNRNYISPLINRKTEVINSANIALSEEQTDFASWIGDFVPVEIKNAVKGNPLISEGKIDYRDSHANITQFTNKAGIITSVLWGYDSRYPIAKIIGADIETVMDQLTVSPPTLQQLDGEPLLTELNHIRINLTQAMVTTYSYKPGVGVISITDPNNKKNSYEYDSFGRLLLIRDQDNNIVKKNEYNYAVPDPNAGIPVFYNVETPGQPLQCQTCVAGYGPTNDPVIYIVPAGRYYSLTSQADANAQASNDIAQNAQDYANRMGLCANTAVCTGEGFKFVGCGCEFGTLINTTCGTVNTDGSWTNHNQYSFSDGSTATFDVLMPACTGADKKKVGCICEPGTKTCDDGPVSLGNNSYRVIYHYEWSDHSVGPSITETLTCDGVDKKMISCTCETGRKKYISSVQCNLPGGQQCCYGSQWLCTYYYRWSDGSTSSTYTECSNADCMAIPLGIE